MRRSCTLRTKRVTTLRGSKRNSPTISRPAQLPAPRRVAATVTEQLPADLVAASWRIVWRTERYNDGLDVAPSQDGRSAEPHGANIRSSARQSEGPTV